MISDLSKLYSALPAWVQQSPAIVLLLLVILGLMTGHLVTGRTFEREMGRCERQLERLQQVPPAK